MYCLNGQCNHILLFTIFTLAIAPLHHVFHMYLGVIPIDSKPNKPYPSCETDWYGFRFVPTPTKLDPILVLITTTHTHLFHTPKPYQQSQVLMQNHKTSRRSLPWTLTYVFNLVVAQGHQHVSKEIQTLSKLVIIFSNIPRTLCQRMSTLCRGIGMVAEFHNLFPLKQYLPICAPGICCCQYSIFFVLLFVRT